MLHRYNGIQGYLQLTREGKKMISRGEGRGGEARVR